MLSNPKLCLSFSDFKTSHNEKKKIIKKQVLKRVNTRKFIVTRFSVSERNNESEKKESQIILLSDNLFTLYKHLIQNIDFEEVNINLIKKKESNNEIDNIFNVLISYSKFKNFLIDNSIPESSIKKAINETNGTKLIKCKENSLINSIYYSKFYIVIRGKINYCEKKIESNSYKDYKNNYFYPGDSFINIPSIPSYNKIDIVSETNSVLLGFSKYSFEYYIKPFLVKEEHEKKEKLFQIFPSLIKIPQNKFNMIFKNCIHENYKKGHFIYREGEKANNIIFILKGIVGLTDKLNNKFLIEINEGCLCGFESFDDRYYKNNLVVKNECHIFKINIKVLKENCSDEILNEIKNSILNRKKFQDKIILKNKKIHSEIKKKFTIVYHTKVNSSKKESEIKAEKECVNTLDAFLIQNTRRFKSQSIIKKFILPNQNILATPNIKPKKKHLTSRNLEETKYFDFSNTNNIYNKTLMSCVTPTKNLSNYSISTYLNKSNKMCLTDSYGKRLNDLKRRINHNFNISNFDTGNFTLPFFSMIENKK